MRKEILHYLYQQKPRYKYYKLNEFLLKELNGGDQKIIGETCADLIQENLIEVEANRDLVENGMNISSHPSNIGKVSYADKVRGLDVIPFNAKILKDGVKEVRADLLEDSVLSTNEKIKETANSTKNLFIATLILAAATFLLVLVDWLRGCG